MIEIMTEIQLTAKTFRLDGFTSAIRTACKEWHWLEQAVGPADLDSFLKRAATGMTAELLQERTAISTRLPVNNTAFGYILWSAASDHPGLDRESHRKHVEQVMETTGSPIAWATSEEAWRNASWRLGPKEVGSPITTTVKGGIQNGLKAAFWRMWFCEPYLSFLGLRRENESCRFVELYEDPGAWSEPASVKASRNFIQQTREDAFYDPERPERQLAAPSF